MRSFLGRSFAAFVGFIILSPGFASGVTKYTDMSATNCVIDNDNAVEANVNITSQSEYRNNDGTNNAYLVCSITVGPGWAANVVSDVKAFLYDGSDDEGVIGYLNWHGVTEANWDDCGSQTTSVGGTGAGILVWQNLDQAGSCLDYPNGAVSLTVNLPDLDVSSSKVWWYYVAHTE
jgi:hypothetical protein